MMSRAAAIALVAATCFTLAAAVRPIALEAQASPWAGCEMIKSSKGCLDSGAGCSWCTLAETTADKPVQGLCFGAEVAAKLPPGEQGQGGGR